MGELSDLDRAILDIESRHWASAGAKEDHVRDRLNLSMTNYHQRLGHLLDIEAALAYAPVTVNRLRRMREAGHV